MERNRTFIDSGIKGISKGFKMSNEEVLKERVEQIIADPKKSKKVLTEIDQYIGKTLLQANIEDKKIKIIHY